MKRFAQSRREGRLSYPVDTLKEAVRVEGEERRSGSDLLVCRSAGRFFFRPHVVPYPALCANGRGANTLTKGEF